MNVKAQSSVYHPFPTTNAQWVYLYYDDFHQPTGPYASYAITGDTIFSGINYKRITGCTSWGACNSGGVRDSNKIIYFRPDTATIEYVLYDFNLNVGDTMVHPFGGMAGGNDTITIMSVDSVQASDGYHRRLWISTWDRWIEGIGSMEYLFAPAGNAGVSGNDILVCMGTDSGFVYPLGLSSCFVSVPEDSPLEYKISISPNPFTDKINITVKTNELLEVSLYDVTSRKIFNQSFTTSTTINTEQLAKGIYLYEVRNKDGVIKKGKVVKE